MTTVTSSLRGTLLNQERVGEFQFLFQYNFSVQYYFMRCFLRFASFITIFILGETLEGHI